MAALCMAATAWSADRNDAELTHLVHHDCGSCHGLRLVGGLGPALTPEALADRPTEWIAAVILHGVAGTAMPRWKGLLTDGEAGRIAKYLKERIHESR